MRQTYGKLSAWQKVQVARHPDRPHAKDYTAALIEASIKSAADGHEKVSHVVKSIGAITASVGNVKHLVDDVSEASRQQTQGIEQVASAVSQMERVTQQTAATSEESAAASEELNAQAETSMHEVHELERLVFGRKAHRQETVVVRGTQWTAPTQTTSRKPAPSSTRDAFAPTGTDGGF